MLSRLTRFSLAPVRTLLRPKLCFSTPFNSSHHRYLLAQCIPSQLFCSKSNPLRQSESTPKIIKVGGHSKVLKPFLLADIGEGITGCEIVKWLVEPGQRVVEFDPIAEVQSDKATVEITSPFEGTVETLLGAQGEIIKVGEPLCMISVDELAPDSDPNLSIVDQVSEASSNVTEPNLVGNAPYQQQPDSISWKSGSPKIDSTPAVRRLAREHQIDINDIVGTGKNGRVVKEDLFEHLKKPSMSDTSASISQKQNSLNDQSEINSTQAQTENKPDRTSSGSKRVILGPVQEAMYRGMRKSLEIPHFSYSDKIDVTRLDSIRRNLSVKASSSGGTKVTLLNLLVKIMGRAMIEHPLFRSTLSSDQPPQLIQRDHADISIAISTPAGLLSPVIPSVDQKTVLEISQHIQQLRQFLSSATKNGKIPRIPEELGGNRTGTLTLSNIGMIGGTYTHPIIPATGQLCIGAIGQLRAQPTYTPQSLGLIEQTIANNLPLSTLDYQSLHIEPRLIIHVSFSSDHRVVEGVELAHLVQTFKEYCQTPENLIGCLI